MYDKARQGYSEDIQSPKDISLEERIERIIHTPELELDGNPYTILSTVGHKGKEIYYDQNIFKGKASDVFNAARNSTDAKYSRLNKILKSMKEGDWRQVGIALPEAPTTQEND